MQTISMTVFADDTNVAELQGFADKSIKEQEPAVPSNVRGSKRAEDDTYQFSSAFKGFFMVRAEPGQCSALRTRASALYNLTEKTPVAQTQWVPTECFAS